MTASTQARTIRFDDSVLKQMLRTLEKYNLTVDDVRLPYLRELLRKVEAKSKVQS